MRISTGLVIILTMVLLLNILNKPEPQPIVVVDTGGVPCPIYPSGRIVKFRPDTTKHSVKKVTSCIYRPSSS